MGKALGDSAVPCGVRPSGSSYLLGHASRNFYGFGPRLHSRGTFGSAAYDVIFAHSRAAFAYAVQGAGYNIHDIETIHMDMPWWSKNINDNCTVNGKLYVLDGDISLSGLSNSMCLLFNKRIFDEK